MDFLIFHLYVRAPTYAQHARDQKRYIALLETKMGDELDGAVFPAEEEEDLKTAAHS